jgi:hypothetical protein
MSRYDIHSPASHLPSALAQAQVTMASPYRYVFESLVMLVYIIEFMFRSLGCLADSG